MVRKQMALALAMAFLTLCFGCADDLNAPNTTDEAPVLPPTNVEAVALNGGHVEVTWAPSSQPTISGYNLYRREVGIGSPKRINNGRIHSTEFIDNSTVERRFYEYRVTAVSSTGKESRFTAVIIQTRDVLEDGSGKVPALNGGD